MDLFVVDLGVWAEFGVVLATLILAFVTTLTVKKMHLQQRMDRLQKEMTLVVGPLRSHQESDFLFGLTGHRPSRYHSEDMYAWRSYYNYWDDISVNMFLAHPDLLTALGNYITAKEAYWDMLGNTPSRGKTEEGRLKRRRVEITREALRVETDRRSKNLKIELDQLEQQAWWQFWK